MSDTNEMRKLAENRRRLAEVCEDEELMTCAVALLEAADEIDTLMDGYAKHETILSDGNLGVDVPALLARVERLEKALNGIADIPNQRGYICGDENGKCFWDHAADIARAALEVKP